MKTEKMENQLARGKVGVQGGSVHSHLTAIALWSLWRPWGCPGTAQGVPRWGPADHSAWAVLVTLRTQLWQNVKEGFAYIYIYIYMGAHGGRYMYIKQNKTSRHIHLYVNSMHAYQSKDNPPNVQNTLEIPTKARFRAWGASHTQEMLCAPINYVYSY